MTTAGFEPGTFGCHEAMDRTSLFAELVEELTEHPAIVGNEEWLALAIRARDALMDLYQEIGKAHQAPVQ